MSNEILVLGGTGTVGAKLAELLRERGETVRIASRRPHADSADAVRFDFQDPSSFAGAFDGVDRAYLLSPAGYTDQPGLLRPVIDFAASRGVKIVLQTAMGVDADEAIPFRQLERHLERSGTPFVILRPNWFSDNFATYWRGHVAGGALRLPAGEGETSLIDTRDIAAAAVGALTSGRHDGRAFDLTGPEALGYDAAARMIEKAIGRPLAYQPVDEDTFVAETAAAGVPRDYAEMIAAIFHAVRAGWAARVTDAVEELSGARPRSLAVYLRDNAGLLAG